MAKWTLKGVWDIAASKGEPWSIEDVEQRIKNLAESTVFLTDSAVYKLISKHSVSSRARGLSFVTGRDLESLCALALSFKPRDAYFEMEAFCNDQTLHSKVGVLYGMRNTGKTIILQQLAGSPEFLETSAYLTLGYRQCKVWELEDLIQRAVADGFRYIYIDEATWAEDFVDYSMGLADKFPMAKIVLSGTDSLSFLISAQDALYHRTVFARTTWMSFPEFKRILGGDILSYIHSGGVFWGASPLSNDLRDYLETSVVDNIYNTINNIDKRHMGRDCLMSLTKPRLYNIIYAICQSLIISKLLAKVNELWGQVFAHGLKNALYSCGIRLSPLDYQDLQTDSYPYDAETSKYDAEQVRVIVAYLQKINFLTNVRLYTGQLGVSNTLVFTQAGVEREFTRNVIMGVLQSQAISDGDKHRVILALDSHSEGDILESTVTLSLQAHFAALGEKVEISKFREFSGDFEIDTVLNVPGGPLHLLEVKRSTQAKTDHAGHLSNPNAIALIEKSFGKKVCKRIILYRGQTCTLQVKDVSVQYINIEDFLLSIDDYIDI